MSTLFAILFFFTPLILWPFTSEVFEFNKMVFVYAMTTLSVASWIIRMIIKKRFIFRRTILDWPLIGYLVTSLASTLFSIDPRTSWLGYYSRFNGGMLSIISYSLLYWAFVSNMDHKSALSAMRYMLYAAVIVSIYGILEHFGVDKNIWVQDVQNRVFSTLGQPNWLAAFLIALMPLAWSKMLNAKSQMLNYFLSALFFITLLFTKSRSGFLGFVFADLIFWGFIFWNHKKESLRSFIIYHLSFIILFLAIGSPFTDHRPLITPQGPSLEVGGTESGEIRKIVWKGAIEIWKHHPILGTGPETFAYAYYQFRPVEHNLVSEWDFIYNKAHNEYLNLAANTGTIGLLSYLILIGFSVSQILNSKSQILNSLLAGYAGLLVSNFFGFSVVPTQLLLFLFPAIALTLNHD